MRELATYGFLVLIILIWHIQSEPAKYGHMLGEFVAAYHEAAGQ